MMRQEDKFDEFDLKVKGLLENAEETVPPRVWGAISSRLDDMGAARRNASRRIVWTAASFALAAALAVGLLLPHNFNKDANAPSQAAPVQELLANELPVPDNEPSVHPQPSVSYQPSVHAEHPAQAKSSVRPEPSVQAEPSARPEPSVQAESPVQQESSAQSGSSARHPESFRPSDADNSLIAMSDWGIEDDSDRFVRKISMGLEGTFNVNDSRISNGRDFRSHMTSGTVTHTMTAIEEGTVSAYDIPLSFGLTIRYQFAPRFSVGSGVTYSLIGRTFSGTYYEADGGIPTKKIQGDIRHTMHYIGVPVNFYFDFVQAKSINCYVYAGGTADFCVSNKYTIEDIIFRDPVNNPQFSVGAGLGVQFMVSKLIGLYIDPGVRYYFRCDQPKSIRTDQPLMVNFEAGLRFNL